MDGCSHKPLVSRLLTGDLSASRTNAVMDHVRQCETCRAHLDVGGTVLPVAENAARGPLPVPSARLAAAGSGRPSPRVVLFLVAIVVITLWASGAGATGGKERAESLAILLPTGEIDTREMVSADDV